MSTITQVQCDIENCAENAAFTGVETSVKAATGQNLEIKKIDLCTKHKQTLFELTPIGISGNSFVFSHTNAMR